jgi:hypothetical protein
VTEREDIAGIGRVSAFGFCVGCAGRRVLLAPAHGRDGGPLLCVPCGTALRRGEAPSGWQQKLFGDEGNGR